jgi:hypothetical protein
MNDKTTQGVAKKMWDDLDFSSEESVNAEEDTFDMIPRAEADAMVVKRQKEIEAVVGLMEPYVNSVEQVTMRVMFAEYYHGAKFINVIGRRDGVEKRFEADWLKHLPRALENMLAEARREGYLEGWRFAYRQSERTGLVPGPDYAAIRAEAE